MIFSVLSNRSENDNITLIIIIIMFIFYYYYDDIKGTPWDETFSMLSILKI